MVQSCPPPLKLVARTVKLLPEETEILMLLVGLVITPETATASALAAAFTCDAALAMTVVPSHSLAKTPATADGLVKVTVPDANQTPELPCVTTGPVKNTVVELLVSAISAVVKFVRLVSIGLAEVDGVPVTLA